MTGERREVRASRWLLAAWLVQLVSCTDIRDVRGPPRQNGDYESQQFANVGQAKKRLTCPVHPDQTTIVQWYKGEELIDNFWTRYKIAKELSLSLRIKDVEMEDAGLFICKVSNGFGRIQFNFTLTVIPDASHQIVTGENEAYPVDGEMDPSKGHIKPYFLDLEKMMKKRDNERPMGSTLRLRCNAEGNPVPVIHWYKVGSDLPLLNEEETRNRRHSTLKLPNLREEDSGEYKCVVTNRHGQINFTYTVEVIGQITDEATLVGSDPENQTVSLGGQALFQCKVKSKDKPNIRWLKRLDGDLEHLTINKSNIFEVKDQKFLVLPTDEAHPRDGHYINKLIIRQVKHSDAGMYICLATNALGYTYRLAFLDIREVADEPRDLPKHGVSGSSLDDISLDDGSDGAGSSGSLPLVIAVPACVAIVVVAIAIFVLKRRRQCNNSANSNAASNSKHRNTRFNAVPTQEREVFSPAPVNIVHNNAHLAMQPPPQNMKGPMSANRSSDKMSKNHSIDFYSDISSVSRCHPHQGHSNHQYGY